MLALDGHILSVGQKIYSVERDEYFVITEIQNFGLPYIKGFGEKSNNLYSIDQTELNQQLTPSIKMYYLNKPKIVYEANPIYQEKSEFYYQIINDPNPYIREVFPDICVPFDLKLTYIDDILSEVMIPGYKPFILSENKKES